MSDDAICHASATDLARRIRRRDLSAREVIEAHVRRIEAVEPKVNAFVTLDLERAVEQADAADAALARDDAVGPLHGLPLGVKDLFETAGLRTTYGSPIYDDNVPGFDRLIVEREKAAGAIVLGKTNTPEFGAGAQTFNAVAGTTLNPYDLSRTCGGSSGGSAVALACGMVALADGSDHGGSLRAPAAWCNVVGMRPSPGRVPSYPALQAWSDASVDGPLARTVEDVALLLSVLAGPDPRSPIGVEEPGEIFRRPLERDLRGVRVALSTDLGFLPIEPEVAAVVEAARPVLESLGCEVVDACPDVRGASEVFKTLRAAKFAVDRRDEMASHRHLLKETILENAEQGLALGGLDTSDAEVQRTVLWHRVREFMERHEFMVWPVNPVPPFPADQETLTAIGGQPVASYIDWGAFRHIVSVLGLPAVSVPGGFTPGGLPAGIQIIGRHHADFAVLQLAHAFEQATEHGARRPAVVGPPSR